MTKTMILSVKRQIRLTKKEWCMFILIWDSYRYCYNMVLGALKYDLTLGLTSLSRMLTAHREKEVWLQKVHRSFQITAIKEAIKACKKSKSPNNENINYVKKTKTKYHHTIIANVKPTISDDRKTIKLPGLGKHV